MKIPAIIRTERATVTAFFGLLINVLYGIGNAALGIATNSLWYVTLSAYYITLSIIRFVILFYTKKGKSEIFKKEIFVKRFSGFAFFPLSVILIGTTVLSVKRETGTARHEIIMITVAAYTFTKITVAVINLCKSRKCNSQIITALRNVALADAAVSVFSMQRSMLVTFGDMQNSDIKIFNTLTGFGVCLFVILLGINLVRKD